jgi:hypothetical protein
MNEPLPSRPHEPANVVYRWDLDKTYVQTEFSTVRGLLQAAVEGAHRKRTIPGMRSLLGALSQAPGARVIVVSGSPEMLRKRVLAMFGLHGIRCDRLVLKDFSGALQRGRLRTLKAQVPYKLRAHLDTRLWLTAQEGWADAELHAGEICFGDDAEVDALIYCLYADVCARRVSPERLARILAVSGAYPDEIASILEKLPLLPEHDPVRRVFIHLEGNSPPARFGGYQGRVLPTFNALQIALTLAADGLADDSVTVAVVEELVRAHQVDADGLAGSLEDAVRRGLCPLALAARVTTELLPRTVAFEVGFRREFAERVLPRLGPERPQRTARTEPLAYERLFESERAFAQARKLALRTAGRIPGLSEFLESRDDD